ncbi:MAG: hypothetical protein QOD42_3645 [Sphingomonadales bacterium]|jgi:Ca2+-binding RTX toxin-like protein|nr:hypothetical protein [Sphingomonadales bacterium]
MKKLSPKNQLTIDGTPGDDLLIGTADGDVINGFDGNDTLIGEGGPDFLTGGNGNDDYRVETIDDRVNESVGGGFDRVYAVSRYLLAAGQEIEFLAFIDPASTVGVLLDGNEFAQTIIGCAGNDGIVGGLGNDVMAGLGGNDTYQVQDIGDVVLEDVGGGTDGIFVHPIGSYTLRAGQEIENVAALFVLNTTLLDLTGNEFANRMIGSNGRNTLIGGGGNDILEGLIGSDVYRVDDMGDIIVEGSDLAASVDAVYVAMNLSGYTLNQGAQIEVLSPIDPASTIAFNLTGNDNHNTIFGTAGVNILIGGAGFDTLAGGAGNDIYRVEEANDNVIEAAGNGYDSVYAVTSYTLTAGQQIEVLAAIDPASTGAMNLTGNAAANEVYGSAGVNIVDGKGGTDLLYGFGGADIFAFTAPPANGDVDTVGDFLAGTDKIGLDDAVFAGIGTPGAFNANAFVVGAAAADGDDRIVYNQATGQLFYDSDGNGAGGAILFATLVGTPTLGVSDFTVL